MTQNIYDRPDFFTGYSQLRRSVDGLEGATEWPMMRSLLPDVTGMKIVDLGCGFGWFCRWAREQGAASVLGIDVSENMLARARERADPGVSYERGDLETLRLESGAYDLVYSSLAFHYIESLAAAFAEVHGALVAGGSFVFSIEHPIYMAPRRPAWSADAQGRRIWPLDSYLIEGPRVTDWLADGVVKHHRTLGATLNLLIGAGFQIERVEEFCPSPAQIAERPELEEERDRPMFLLVRARR
jgi:SAM-dependent methyltransferase